MKLVLTLLKFAVAAYAAYCLLLYLMQDRLIYPRRSGDASLIAELQKYYKNLESMEVIGADGGRLRGWFLPGPEGSRRALLYFGGNAEEAARTFLWAPGALPGLATAAADYRGYGRSDGSPDASGILADAPLVYDAVKKRLGPGGRVAVMGRSLGVAAAARVAAERDPEAVILVTPFDSLAAVAADNYPLVPVRWLLRQRFETTADAARAGAPALFIAAAGDSLVKAARSEALADAWKGPKEYRVLPGGHNTVSDNPDYWTLVAAFLNGF